MNLIRPSFGVDILDVFGRAPIGEWMGIHRRWLLHAAHDLALPRDCSSSAAMTLTLEDVEMNGVNAERFSLTLLEETRNGPY